MAKPVTLSSDDGSLIVSALLVYIKAVQRQINSERDPAVQALRVKQQRAADDLLAKIRNQALEI